MNHQQIKENAPKGAELYALIKCKVKYFYKEGNQYFFMSGKEYFQASITKFYRLQ